MKTLLEIELDEILENKDDDFALLTTIHSIGDETIMQTGKGGEIINLLINNNFEPEEKKEMTFKHMMKLILENNWERQTEEYKLYKL